MANDVMGLGKEGVWRGLVRYCLGLIQQHVLLCYATKSNFSVVYSLLQIILLINNFLKFDLKFKSTLAFCVCVNQGLHL